MLVVVRRTDDRAEVRRRAPRTILRLIFGDHVGFECRSVGTQRQVVPAASVGERAEYTEHRNLRERFHLTPPGVVCREPNQPVPSDCQFRLAASQGRDRGVTARGDGKKRRMIEFRMLGTLHLTDAAGHEVKRLLTRSRRLALLAYLAASAPRRFHRRDSLLALFWPELDQEHARAALRQALHVLRGALGGDVVVTRGDEEIGLDFTGLWCDVVAFDEAIAAGQLAVAVDCYKGDLLDGFFISGAGDFERWLERERARLREAVSGAARTLIEQCEAAGDVAAAAQHARRATRLARHDEDLVRRFVTLLDPVGDRAGAVAAYDAVAECLRVDLETEPAAETNAFIRAVRERQTAAPV